MKHKIHGLKSAWMCVWSTQFNMFVLRTRATVLGIFGRGGKMVTFFSLYIYLLVAFHLRGGRPCGRLAQHQIL